MGTGGFALARRLALGLAVGLIVGLGSAAGPGARAQEVQAALAAKLDGVGAIIVDGAPVRALVSLRRFYAERSGETAWNGADAAVKLDGLLDAVAAAGTQGLNPADYHLERLRAAMARGDALAVELLATDAFLTYGAHLLGGRLNPVSVEPDWTAARRERDLVAHLSAALDSGDIAGSLAALEPDAPSYPVLKAALAEYSRAAKAGGWSAIPGGPKLELGVKGPRVAMLRQRLELTGLLAPADDGSADVFDQPVENAVADFQRRIGLEPDGVVGPMTLAQLNIPAEARVAQIRANLERWRWLPQDLGPRHIRVNIADYRLEARNNGRIERVHNVVVGRTARKTPVFSEAMRYIVLNPWWETPPNLARQDKLPAFQKDPAQVQDLGFEVLDRSGSRVDPATIDWKALTRGNFPYRLRQRPGPLNALGQVKMMFPNPHNVYLHDTPSRELFRRNARAFSSGCVRVEDPLSLAAWALGENEGWDRARIDSVIGKGDETTVTLSRKLPVHILYFTAVVDTDGSLRLVADVYDRDARLIAALDRPAPLSGAAN
ncbi:MAG: L,D-transpeptidase family protein [Pseudomonadota bacterium]|nr:L,D-transpeptidase family protein [Pseudomonadota bacterium]